LTEGALLPSRWLCPLPECFGEVSGLGVRDKEEKDEKELRDVSLDVDIGDDGGEPEFKFLFAPNIVLTSQKTVACAAKKLIILKKPSFLSSVSYSHD
jgi:hypothetical protein